ncbi:unnamed protein product [Coffea canephora]|uniref:Uncharacterized protein n=1 Tax=Coffea canephora TaxID=49390 RepID=A0A068U2E2_COFCA|nr:unnamed protein product [Coffea canephora]
MTWEGDTGHQPMGPFSSSAIQHVVPVRLRFALSSPSLCLRPKKVTCRSPFPSRAPNFFHCTF